MQKKKKEGLQVVLVGGPGRHMSYKNSRLPLSDLLLLGNLYTIELVTGSFQLGEDAQTGLPDSRSLG
jgi:hypothetical protein